jgi:hypothetical protein
LRQPAVAIYIELLEASDKLCPCRLVTGKEAVVVGIQRSEGAAAEVVERAGA